MSIILLLSFATAPRADDRLVRLAVPQVLVDSGLMKHILPRFSLKTQVRVRLVGPGDTADMALGGEGTPLFEGPAQVWAMQVLSPDHPGTQRLADWLTSDIGKRTILGFAPEGAPLYSEASARQIVVAAVEFDGDAVQGRSAARTHCGRCHAVAQDDRWNDIGSTPSFFVLRTFADWQERFSAFYVLKPHAAFTQITDVTPPFPDDRPPPIVPIELSLDEVEAILAYVAGLEPADLGKPLVHQ